MVMFIRAEAWCLCACVDLAEKRFLRHGLDLRALALSGAIQGYHDEGRGEEMKEQRKQRGG
ncbi:hypothetical protein BM1_08505 [Bipolaris maydis]|nr:hypothetical protein BM1_08505 [Bipolaris maydis]